MSAAIPKQMTFKDTRPHKGFKWKPYAQRLEREVMLRQAAIEDLKEELRKERARKR